MEELENYKDDSNNVDELKKKMYHFKLLKLMKNKKYIEIENKLNIYLIKKDL